MEITKIVVELLGSGSWRFRTRVVKRLGMSGRGRRQQKGRKKKGYIFSRRGKIVICNNFVDFSCPPPLSRRRTSSVIDGRLKNPRFDHYKVLFDSIILAFFACTATARKRNEYFLFIQQRRLSKRSLFFRSR